MVEVVDKFHLSEEKFVDSFKDLYKSDFYISNFCAQVFVLYPGIYYVKEQ